jgi:hypothetical protein
MTTGEHFSGSCGDSVNEWGTDTIGGGYFHSIGQSVGLKVVSGTCFGKTLDGLTLFNGRILV